MHRKKTTNFPVLTHGKLHANVLYKMKSQYNCYHVNGCYIMYVTLDITLGFFPMARETLYPVHAVRIVYLCMYVL